MKNVWVIALLLLVSLDFAKADTNIDDFDLTESNLSKKQSKRYKRVCDKDEIIETCRTIWPWDPNDEIHRQRCVRNHLLNCEKAIRDNTYRNGRCDKHLIEKKLRAARSRVIQAEQERHDAQIALELCEEDPNAFCGTERNEYFSARLEYSVAYGIYRSLYNLSLDCKRL